MKSYNMNSQPNNRNSQPLSMQTGQNIMQADVQMSKPNNRNSQPLSRQTGQGIMQADVQMSTSVSYGTVPGSTCCEYPLGTRDRAAAKQAASAAHAAERSQYQGRQGNQGIDEKQGSPGVLCNGGHQRKFGEYCGNWQCDGADDQGSFDRVNECSTMLEVPRKNGRAALKPVINPIPSVTTTHTRGLVPDGNLKSYIENLVIAYMPHPSGNAEYIERTCQCITAMREATQPFQMNFAYPLPGAATNAVVGHLSAEWRENKQMWDVLFIAVDNVDVCTQFFSPDQVAEQLMKQAQALKHPAAKAAFLKF